MKIDNQSISEFRSIVEVQTPRTLRRYQDYGKRVRTLSGLQELRRWLLRVLLDESVYSLQDKALAFEIEACEIIAEKLPSMTSSASTVTVIGPVDKVFLFVALMDADADEGLKLSCAMELEKRYRKTWKWILFRSQARLERTVEESAEQMARDSISMEFVGRLKQIVPEFDGMVGGKDVEKLKEEVMKQECAANELVEEMRVLAARAHKSQARVLTMETELKGMRQKLRDVGDLEGRLRAERSKRILLEREARDTDKELVRLRQECLKLDRRLRDVFDQGGTDLFFDGMIPVRLKQMLPEQVLGLEGNPGDQEIGEIRRRFAVALHSDRTSQLPGWVTAVFDDLMAFVNEKCDVLRQT
tara:strand:+ start:1027 stop:2100 length:1074 start_codon:yes stop_codon:yes gene_type:complete